MSRLAVEEVCEYIEDFHHNEGMMPDAQTLAQKFNYSPSQFSQLFKSNMQVSVREFVAAKKLN